MVGRPRKQTVDYFPHYRSKGKTRFILQSKYRNDGYAFWFKLLEILSASEGHFYDYSSSVNWQYLLAETDVKEDMAKDILATLASLDAIDVELYSHKIIWVQNLVDNLAEVYKRRQTPLPQKPYREKKAQEGRPKSEGG